MSPSGLKSEDDNRAWVGPGDRCTGPATGTGNSKPSHKVTLLTSWNVFDPFVCHDSLIVDGLGLSALSICMMLQESLSGK